MDPEDGYSYYERGIIKSRLADFDGAMKDYDKSIELNSDDDFAYIRRGFIKIMLDNMEGARRDIEKAVELNPRQLSDTKED